MSIEDQISELIGKYEGLDARRLRQFNEENTKKDFILPLFRHLGWDVTNSDEVAAEEKSSNGRVDYAFKIGGISKFYLEAKPLREDLNQRPDWAKQVITYAENKGVTWAVLTNFKQLMVFNAEWDKPALERARFLNLTYQEYLSAFRKLWWLSRDSVEKGVLDEEARQVGALKPKLPVEKSLLDQLLRWRGELFNQIYQHNKDRGVDLQQVDEPIQQFINRLIFIRSTEDRGIEENRLRATLHQWRDSGRQGELVERIRAIFHEFATLYDSDLFPLLDIWDSLFVESDTIEKIIEGSYERPTRLAGYDFAAIDADVLGAVYEQYLGYVAQEAKKRATEQARLLGFEAPAFELEARRIKRKQQGIYYTPKFVVDYIVKETVGHFIKEHSYNDIFNIKILDPACGSGSFLIRAYDELLHYHARQKGKSPAELDHWERLSILKRNIFGVDLDRQAVEITRLSLLLRSLAKREILPGLADNIRQGNSLISGTEEELRHYFGDDWRDKKRFNWEEEFKDIMKNGGFDVVIGNPPWVALTGPRSKEVSKDEIPYFKNNFSAASDPIIDTYALFLEKATSLLQAEGLLGFILPDIVLLKNYPTIRKHLLDNYCIRKIIHVGRAFEAVNLDAALIIAQKEKNKELRTRNITTVVTDGEAYLQGSQVKDSIPQADFESAPKFKFNIYLSGEKASLKVKLDKHSLRLNEGWECHEGIHSGNIRHKLFTNARITSSDYPLIFGRDEIAPYLLEWAGKWVRYDPSIVDASKGEYAGLGREQYFTVEKLVIRRTGDRVIAAYDDNGFFVSNNMFVLLKREESPYPLYELKFILALLNSKLITAYFRLIQPRVARLFAELKIEHLEQFPIRCIDFDNPTEKKMHDDLVALVDKMLELNKRLAPIRGIYGNERDELLREIDRIDEEINKLVYKLYGLTEEDSEIVESQVT